MRKPEERDATELAMLQHKAAALYADAMRNRNSVPGPHTGEFLVDGIPHDAGVELIGWRVPTAKFDGTQQVPIRDCVITAEGEIFTIDQSRGDGRPQHAHLPVYGLLEGIIDQYEHNCGAEFPIVLAPASLESKPVADAAPRRATSMAEAAEQGRRNRERERLTPRSYAPPRVARDWQTIADAVEEFVPVALKSGIKTKGLVKRHWAVQLGPVATGFEERLTIYTTGSWIVRFWSDSSNQQTTLASSKDPSRCSTQYAREVRQRLLTLLSTSR
jgi:hypothetical protein